MRLDTNMRTGSLPARLFVAPSLPVSQPRIVSLPEATQVSRERASKSPEVKRRPKGERAREDDARQTAPEFGQWRGATARKSQVGLAMRAAGRFPLSLESSSTTRRSPLLSESISSGPIRLLH